MKLIIGKLLAVVILIAGFSLPVIAESFTSPFGQHFVKIKAGEFLMGTADFDLLAKEVDPERLEHLTKERPPHKVAITQDFWMASTEVTQGMWFELMGYQPGREKRWKRDDWADIPVSRVSWDSVQEFIDTVNEMDNTYQYRLPSEAEWEYAARAGTTGLRPFAYDEMADYAWFRSNSNDKPMPVATLKPNAWGLYDMIGNLWEWVNDSYDPDYYSVSPRTDPKGPELSARKVMRGGSYHCTPERVRVAIRGSYVAHRSLSTLGFRLVAEKRQ